MQVIAGRYELHRQIGSGGMGAVWLARDCKLDTWVAVKLLAEQHSAGLLRFVREQSLRIEHPHVVTPQGWAADDDQVALSMDLVRGGSVSTLLGDQGSLPESFVAVLVDQLLDALTAVHAHGVIHRDITPGNLLLEPTGLGRPFLRLSDFGVAAVLDGPRFTEYGTSVGTLGYMPPEQSVLPDPDPRSDLYGVGIVGRQLLTGLPTHQLDTAGAELSRGGLWDALMRLSDKDVHRRPASAALARELVAPLVPAGAPWAGDPDGPCVFEHVQLPAREPPGTPALPPSSKRSRLVPAAVPASPARRSGSAEDASRGSASARSRPQTLTGSNDGAVDARRGFSRAALRVVAACCFALAAALLVTLVVVLV